MMPLRPFHDPIDGFYKIMWFNPTTLCYEQILKFATFEEFTKYAIDFVKGTADDMQTMLSNINTMTMALRYFAPKKETPMPEYVLKAFEERK